LKIENQTRRENGEKTRRENYLFNWFDIKKMCVFCMPNVDEQNCPTCSGNKEVLFEMKVYKYSACQMLMSRIVLHVVEIKRFSLK
jgi:hypothetical protein